MGSPLPLSSLRLLLSPLRIMSAFMWQVVQQQKLEHFNKLEEYILLITKMFPETLSDRQRTALVMGLRAKMILEMCKADEVPIDLETIRERLHTIESKATGSEVEGLQCKLLKLLISLLEDPVKKEHFFQEVFPLEYGPDFDKALQVIVGHFLSRLEQLLPVPSFKQAASWLSTESTVWENLVQNNWNPKYLLPLLRSDCLGTLEINGLPSVVEDRIISTLSLPPLDDVVMPSESTHDEQSEYFFSLDSSCQETQNVNQDINQNVILESETGEPEMFSSYEVEVHTEIENAAVLNSTVCSTQEVSLTENDTEQDPVCKTEERTGSEHGDEALAEVDGLEPESVVSGTDLNLRSAHEESDEDADNTAETNTEQRIKVIVPSHLVEVIKHVQLPSISLSRCTNSDVGQHSVATEVNAASSSSSAENGHKTQTTKRQQRRPHQCSECGMSFRCQVELKAHMRKHTERGPYKCQPCKMHFKTYFQASVHQRKWHSKVTYSCAHCDKKFNSMKAWLLHRREHKDRTVHRCTDCGKECLSLQSLVNHSRLHNHLVSERLPDAYKCIACGDTFSQKSDFVSHMKTHKPRSRDGYNQGRAEKRAKRLPGECRFCGQMFSAIELRSHLKTHPEFRPHQCDHCGKCFATLPGLMAHISNHTGEKPHGCANCGKKFFSKSQLKQHMKSHSKDNLFCCSYCGKCFQSIGNLTIHTRLHTGEKPYVCMDCGKAFSSAGCLQVHRRCHTGEKPYPCSICGRCFLVSSHRTTHMRSHTGLKPFTCEICGKGFTRKRCLDEHMFSHSDMKPFPCAVCSKSFVRRSHLKRHMQCHQDEQSSEMI